MRELIWRSAYLRRQRLLLLIVGAAAITLGLSFLIGVLQQSRTQMMGRLTDRWHASYDILVLPKGSSGPSDLLPPSLLAGVPSGITPAQWQMIKTIDGVEVAAPLVQAGWMEYPISVEVQANPGLYRLSWEQSQSDGLQTYRTIGSDYIWVFPPSLLSGIVESHASSGIWGVPLRTKGQLDGTISPSLFAPAGIEPTPAEGTVPVNLKATLPLAVVAISPEEESRLMGLDHAVVGGSYFRPSDDRAEPERGPDGVAYSLPVLVSAGGYGDISLRLRGERLRFSEEPTESLLRDLAAKGGADYLSHQPAESAFSWQSRPGHLDDLLLPRLGGGLKPWWSVRLHVAPQPVQYEPIASLDPSRWPYAYQGVPAGQITRSDVSSTPLAAWRFTGIREDTAQAVRFHLIGTYDPARIQLPTPDDPSSSLYRVGTALTAFDASGQPVANPVAWQVLSHPRAYLNLPPVVMTTLPAVQSLLPDMSISSIRVRVQGVGEISDTSAQRVEKVAKEIAARTGLHVEIMRGAAPEPVLVHLNSPGASSSFYVIETWLKKGQAVEMLHELRRGDLLILGLVLLVGIVFVMASSVVHVMLRQRELGTLAAVGWRMRSLMLLILSEAAFVSLTGGLVACLLLPRVRTLQAALSCLLLYCLGASLATLATGVANPIRLLRGSGITPNEQLAHVDSLRQVAWGSTRARRRNLLSLAALILPTALLVVLTTLTVRLEDRLFVTVLGSQVALEASPLHYAMMAAAFVLAAATTADLMSLSVIERRSELALLSAIGWRRRSLRLLVLWEGLLWGLASGAGGIALGLALLYLIFGRIQPGLWPLLPVIMSVPAITGLIGAVAPAESAARMEPALGVKEI